MKCIKFFFAAILFVFTLAGCNSSSNIFHKESKSINQSLIKAESRRYDIMGFGVLSEKVMLNWLAERNKKISEKKLSYIVRTYIWEAAYEGVNHDVAFVQMCHETNFLRFGGIVSAKQNNFCGLGTTSRFVSGADFPNIQTGVRAHIQHLKAYASMDKLANRCVDPRFDLVRRNCAKNIFDLTGKWATDKHYGQSLKRNLDALFALENNWRASKQKETP